MLFLLFYLVLICFVMLLLSEFYLDLMTEEELQKQKHIEISEIPPETPEENMKGVLRTYIDSKNIQETLGNTNTNSKLLTSFDTDKICGAKSSEIAVVPLNKDGHYMLLTNYNKLYRIIIIDNTNIKIERVEFSLLNQTFTSHNYQKVKNLLSNTASKCLSVDRVIRHKTNSLILTDLYRVGDQIFAVNNGKQENLRIQLMSNTVTLTPNPVGTRHHRALPLTSDTTLVKYYPKFRISNGEEVQELNVAFPEWLHTLVQSHESHLKAVAFCQLEDTYLILSQMKTKDNSDDLFILAKHNIGDHSCIGAKQFFNDTKLLNVGNMLLFQDKLKFTVSVANMVIIEMEYNLEDIETLLAL